MGHTPSGRRVRGLGGVSRRLGPPPPSASVSRRGSLRTASPAIVVAVTHGLPGGPSRTAPWAASRRTGCTRRGIWRGSSGPRLTARLRPGCPSSRPAISGVRAPHPVVARAGRSSHRLGWSSRRRTTSRGAVGGRGASLAIPIQGPGADGRIGRIYISTVYQLFQCLNRVGKRGGRGGRVSIA